MELRDQLDVIHNSIGDTDTAPLKQTRYRKVLSYAAIASLAVLISLGVLLKVQHNKLTNQQIYQKHFEPYEVTMVYRSAESDELLRQAVAAYDAQNYTVAIGLFEQLMGSYPNEMEYQLSLGISYMETEQYNKADNKFQTIIDHDDNLYIEPAEWYLGFCYLHTDRNEIAREHFKSIAQSNSSYNKKAKTILRRIK
jgi:tetratricopeptide (TPR) repeat protein